MNIKLWLMAICGTLLAAAASGQNTTIVSTNVDFVDACIRKGTEYMNQQNPGEALKAFEQASVIQPDNEKAVLGQYISLVQLKQVNDGAKVLDKWVAAKADDPRRWFCKGMSEAETDRPEEALKSFEKLTELQPDKSGNWLGKGQLLERMKRGDEALKSYDKAVALDPKNADGWNIRSELLLGLGKYDDAIKSYAKVIELKPNWADPLYNRACLYARKGDKTNALADLTNAIKLQQSLKGDARNDEDFKSMSSDPDFKKLTE